jgi:tol-pal system protein YbgF
MVRWIGGALLLVSTSCATLEDRDNLRHEIQTVRDIAAKNEVHAAELATQLDDQLKRLKGVVEEANRVVLRNSADVGGKVDKMQQDLAQLTGRIDDLQHSSDALTKQFQDYRAQSDTKLEQLTNASTAAKSPPVPETADAVVAEAEKRMQAAQYGDARRLYDAFLNRYPQDARAPKAQFQIGEAYAAEKKYANAINAYQKVIDNFSKSEVMPDAMYKDGVAFYALKYCSDARIYFQELLRRYPRTSWKGSANEQLRKLAKDLKNKALCSS